MLPFPWQFLLGLDLTWGLFSLLLTPSLAHQSVGHHQAQDKEVQLNSAIPASPFSQPSPVPAFLHAHLPPLIPFTQRTQPRNDHPHLPDSLSLLPQTSCCQMRRSSRDKSPSIAGNPMTKISCSPVFVLLDSVDSVQDHVKPLSMFYQKKLPCLTKQVKINSSTNLNLLKLTKKMRATLSDKTCCDCSIITKRVDKQCYVCSLPYVDLVTCWKKYRRNSAFMNRCKSSITHIPRNFSPWGVHMFHFTVSVLNPDLPLLEESSEVYVVSERKLLKADNFSDYVVLDGCRSKHPGAVDTLGRLLFIWHCVTNAKICQGDKIIPTSKDMCICCPQREMLQWISDPDSVLKILPETLEDGCAHFIRFRMDRNDSSVFTDQVVHALQAPMLNTYILCIENCGNILVISDRFSLLVTCTNCPESPNVYEWSLLSWTGGEIPFDWKGLTTTGRNRDYLSIKAFALKDFLKGQYSISVQIKTWNGMADILKYTFIINPTRRYAECKIKPHKGTAIVTKFVVTCGGDFQDDNTLSRYKVIVSESDNVVNISSLKENTMGGISYFGPKFLSSFFLPVGALSADYSLKLYVQEYDAYGTFSQVTLVTTVVAPTDHLSPETVLHRLHNLTWGPNSTLSDLIQKKDFLAAGYLIYVAASVLNSMRNDSIVQDDLIKLREHLVNQTFELPLNTSEEIIQVVAALAKLTQGVSDFTERYTERISQANQALQQYRKKNRHFHSEQIDSACTGILISLSNLLKFSTHQKIFYESIHLLDALADTILASVIPDNKTTVLQSKIMNIYVKKTEKWNAAKVSVQAEDGRNDFHAAMNFSRVPGLSENAPISTTFIEFVEDPFPWITYRRNSLTDVVGFRMSGVTANGDEIEITPEVAEVHLARKTLSSEVFNITMRPSSELDMTGETFKTITGAFRFEVDCSELREVLVHIITEMTLLFTTSVYAGGNLTDNALVATYLVPHDMPPMVNQSELLDSNCTVKAARVVCLSPSLLQVILQRVQSTECVIAMVLQAPRFIMSPSDKLVRISVFRAQCVDMYGIQSEWNEHTCTLGEKTTWQRVHCVCKPKVTQQPQTTPISGNLQQYSHYLAAKVIDICNHENLRFQVGNISRNPVTSFVILFIMITYIGLAFWVLHQDETEKFFQQPVIILPDNDPYDKTCYLVTVFTGSRCGSGTTANVFVQLLGTESVSDVHCLSHPHFTTLYRRSINTFLVTTKSDLGDIYSIRVWHDNKGSSPSWYLSRIKVENEFTRQIWLFMCREWISVDTALYRTFNAFQPEQSLSKIDFVLIDVTYKMWKSHMWFSVFADVDKPFNRLQRLSCCLAVLLSSLLCNIMLLNLNPTEEMESSQGKYTRSIVIGMNSVLITLPIQVVITVLFIYSQRKPLVTLSQVAPQKHPRRTPICEKWAVFLLKWHNQETYTPAKTPDKRTSKYPKVSAKDTKANAKPDVHVEEPTLQAEPAHIQTKTQFVLPSCFVYLAWFLVFATCSISSFFIVLYGLTYGYDKSVKWLFASFCAFFLSVFLVQPAKIILFSGLQTTCIKYCKNLSWVSSYQHPEISLQYLNMEPWEKYKLHQRLVKLHDSKMYQRPTDDQIKIFQRRRRIKKKAFLFLSYILTHFIFLALLLNLVALLHLKDSFYYNQFIWHQFSMDLVTVTKLDDIYSWLDRVPLPLFHNDLHPTFLPDSSSKILGLPQMRQVRAKSGGQTCQPIKRFAKSRAAGEIHCHPEYDSDPEDTENYTSSWNTAANQVLQDNNKGFTYKPPESRWAYSSYGLSHTYGSGGYAFYFFPEEQQYNSSLRIKDLQSSHWLDGKTWAVILELTTLNVDMSLFCSISVIFEISQVGVVNTSLSAHSFLLADFNRNTSSEIYLYVATLIFFLAYIVDEVYVVTQERALYVRSVYNLLNLALKCLFLVLIVLFIRKHIMARGLIQFNLSNPVSFIPFHAVSHVDHIMRIILGFLLFLTILKTLRYSRIFYDVRLAQRAIQAALPGICHMAFVVSVYFFVYMAFGYLVFGQHEWNYSHLIHSTQTIFSYCVSAFQNTEFSNNKILGILFLSSFMLVMICILINLFQAVILSSYEEMKQPVYEEPSEEAEAMAYLYDTLGTMLSSVCLHSEGREEPEFFVDMVYGQPERNSHRYLGLKTRNINEKKRIYLVI